MKFTSKKDSEVFFKKYKEKVEELYNKAIAKIPTSDERRDDEMYKDSIRKIIEEKVYDELIQ